MSEEADPVVEKIGCGARLGMLLLIAAILAVIFFLLINPMLISRDIDLLGKLKLRGIFTRQTTAGESVAVQEENQAQDRACVCLPVYEKSQARFCISGMSG